MTTNTKTSPISANAPNPALIPNMAHDHEVPLLVANEENAEISQLRRQEKVEDREAKNHLTRVIAGTAAVATAVTLAGVNTVNRANASPKQNHPEYIKVNNADGRQGAVKFVPWETATAVQKHAALVESGAIQPEP